MLIGYTQLPDKLLFARSLELSLRDQSADWSWQSPNNSGRFVRAFVRFTYNPEDLGDCHVAALLAMTAFIWCAKQQFVGRLSITDKHILFSLIAPTVTDAPPQVSHWNALFGWAMTVPHSQFG